MTPGRGKVACGMPKVCGDPDATDAADIEGEGAATPIIPTVPAIAASKLFERRVRISDLLNVGGTLSEPPSSAHRAGRMRGDGGAGAGREQGRGRGGDH